MVLVSYHKTVDFTLHNNPVATDFLSQVPLSHHLPKLGCFIPLSSQSIQVEHDHISSRVQWVQVKDVFNCNYHNLKVPMASTSMETQKKE